MTDKKITAADMRSACCDDRTIAEYIIKAIDWELHCTINAPADEYDDDITFLGYTHEGSVSESVADMIEQEYTSRGFKVEMDWGIVDGGVHITISWCSEPTE